LFLPGSLPESTEDGRIDGETDELVNKVSSLSIGTEHAFSDSRSMIRQVTLPQEEEFHCSNETRLSMGSSKNDKLISSRPSFDAHASSMDLNLHFYGNSPRVTHGRPPKSSMGGSSVCSLEAGQKNRGSLGRMATPPCNSDRMFVTTYVDIDDR
jgi:hypothetical protein